MRKPPRTQYLSDTPTHVLARDEGGLRSTAFNAPDDELLALASRTVVLHEVEAHEPSTPQDAAPVVLRPLPPGAPPWMRAARALSLELERSITQGKSSRAAALSVQRATLAYSALDSPQERIARVARLVRRAHHAIRETRRPEFDAAVRDCAEIIYDGLSGNLRRTTPFDAVLAVVRELYAEADPWLAVVQGTSTLLGWRDAARTQAAQAIRVALEEERAGHG